MVKKVVINTCYGGFGISKECAEWMLNNGVEEPFKFEIEKELNSEGFYGYMFNDYRTESVLIKAIEELGSKVCSGSCAELEIAELADNEFYRISEYDGNEEIETRDMIEWNY